MAEKDDLHSYRKTAPESGEEWKRLNRSLYRADAMWEEWEEHKKAVHHVKLMWPIVKPVQAFVVNIRAWLAIVAFLAIMRRTEVMAALDAGSSWAGGSK